MEFEGHLQDQKKGRGTCHNINDLLHSRYTGKYNNIGMGRKLNVSHLLKLDEIKFCARSVYTV